VVHASSNSIHTASGEVSSGNNDLSIRTEQQSSNLQQTAAAMEQLTSAVQVSSANAREANALAGTATDVAVSGGTAVQDVVNTMQQIQASSQKIAEIIGVIDGIAFQTNILAPQRSGRGRPVRANKAAALQWSRAKCEASHTQRACRQGDQGADRRIRRSRLGRHATRRQRRAEDGRDRRAGETSLAADRQIAGATQEQSSGIGQVNESVTQLDQMTQQNAALVEESAAAAESLKDQARKLAQAVSAFKLE